MLCSCVLSWQLLRSHLGMYGSWHSYAPAEPWQKPVRRAAIILDTQAVKPLIRFEHDPAGTRRRVPGNVGECLPQDEAQHVGNRGEEPQAEVAEGPGGDAGGAFAVSSHSGESTYNFAKKGTVDRPHSK